MTIFYSEDEYMKKRTRILSAFLLAFVICIMLAIPALADSEGEAVSTMYGTFWALIPPIVAIVLALITKEAYSSLFIGILVGALLHCGFAPVATLDTMLDAGFVTAISDNAGIFLFLVLLGIIVALVNASGGSAAFGRWAEKNIKTRVGAMLAPSFWVCLYSSTTISTALPSALSCVL